MFKRLSSDILHEQVGIAVFFVQGVHYWYRSNEILIDEDHIESFLDTESRLWAIFGYKMVSNTNYFGRSFHKRAWCVLNVCSGREGTRQEGRVAIIW